MISYRCRPILGILLVGLLILSACTTSSDLSPFIGGGDDEGAVAYIEGSALARTDLDYSVSLGQEAQATIGAFSFGVDLVLVTSSGVHRVRNDGPEQLVEFENPGVFFEIATARDRVVFAVAGAAPRDGWLIYRYDGDLSSIQPPSDDSRLLGVLDQGSLIEDRGHLKTLTDAGAMTELWFGADKAASAFTGTTRILVDREDGGLEIIDIDSAGEVKVQGFESTGEISQAVSRSDGSAVFALIVDTGPLDDQNQRPSLGLWEIRMDGSTRMIADLANDDIMGGFDQNETTLIVHAAESRPDSPLVAVDLSDGAIEPVELPRGSVPLGWSLPMLFEFARADL